MWPGSSSALNSVSIDGSNNSDTVTITDNDSALNSVSITATDPGAAEASSNPGQFTVDLGTINNTGSAVTVNYTVTGTATNGGTDYTSLSGSVSIADGQQTATIDVAGIIDDALVEGNETVIVTLDNTSDSLFGIDGSNNSDTVTITDNDSALNSVSISATDASAAEASSNPGQFTVDLGTINNTGSAVTINYTVTGTATNGGTDYTSLSGSVSIADGQQTATIDVAGIIDDALVEGNETVIVTLDTTDNGLFTIDGSNNSDTVTITDNDSALNSVSISATDASAAEASSNPGQFTVDLGTINNTGSAVTVNYTVTGTATNGGTDYTSLSGSVSIADGQQTATIAVAGIIDDALVEGNETVIVTLDTTDSGLFTIDGSNNSDTVTITDNDSALNSVSISATDASAAETGTDPGQFTVDLGVVNHTGSAVTVNYTVTGTATNGGTDYTSLSGSVSIADGQQTATIDVAGIIDDALVEGNETVIVTLDTTNNGLFTIDGSNNSDTVTITDNDSALNSVSISATDASAAETGTDPGQFTVDLGTINNTGSAVTVNYTVTGTATNGSTDYTSLSGSVSIADGQQTATIAVAGIIDDALVEGNETVIVTLDTTDSGLFTIDGSNNSDTVTITDNDSALNSVSITATDASAAEASSNPGQFTVDLGVVNHTGSAVTVNYTVTGTATNGSTDYTSLSGSVSIADGQQTATIAVAGIIDDALVEGNETVIVTLDTTDSGLFTIDGSNNSDTVTITDNDSALNSVSITATDASAAEASSNPGQFTVDLGVVNHTGSAVTVNYTVTGTATNGSTDYTSLSGSVSIADGQQTATIAVAGIIDDALVEGNETVIVTLDSTSDSLFTIDGSNNSDTVTITDNDSALNSVSISATDASAAETGTDPGQFTVDLGVVNHTGSAVTVNYTVTGTATNGGTDYTSLSGSVSIADGQQTATIAVAGIIDDALVEGNETVIVTLDTTDSGLFTIDGSNNSDTVTITDNDSALNSVSITATDPGAAEASSNPGQFTVDLGTINNTGSAVTVNYTVAGTATNGGTDYTSLSGSVSIADGQQTATIDVAGIIDDALVEGNETVIVTLDATNNGLFTIDGSNNSDTVTITDNDSALNSVSISATDPGAAEASSNPGQFTVDLGTINNTGSAVTVNYTVTGTATNGGTDYTSLSGSVSIADGQQTATIAVAGIIDDALVEGNETVIVTLDTTDNGLFTIDGSNNSDTVTITDNDSALNSVSISATDASAAETGTDPGQFTVDLGVVNHTGSAVTVNYTVTGTATNGSTDYTSLSGSVSIADGQQTATIAVAGIIDDALVEGNETVIVTLDSTSDSLFTIDGSNNSDTVTITDNDSALNSVSISATDASAAEASSNPGQFTVDLGTINNTGSAVTINYTVTGTATNGGTDYTSLSGSVSIADGQQTATIDVAGIIDDALVEGNETVIVTLDTTNNGLFTIDGSNNSDTVTITDNDSALNSVSISATDASAAETGTDPGQFTVDLGTINNTGSAVTVNYTVTGTATNGSTDYTSLSGSVSIADGQQTATIAVAGIIDDALVEGNETVIVTLDTTDSGLFTIDGSNNSDTVTITDNDSALNSVSITATDASAAEASSNPGQFTVDLGVVNHTGSAVTVNYTVTGTATNGSTDYTSLSGSVSIADGQQTATIAVAGIIDDALVEGNETVIVTLDSTSDSLFTIDGSNNSDTVTITDNDSALNSVSISATDASAAETGTDPGQFTVDLGVVNHTGSAVTVNYTVTGTATNGGTDYTSLSGSVSIADGQQTATIDVAGIIDDALVEGNETVIVTLDTTNNGLFTIDGSNNSDTVTITDNDSALNSVSISATDASAAETGTDPGQFTVDLGTINNTGSAVTVNYTVTGTATNGSTDYTSLSGSVSIADGQQTATIAVAGIIDDALVEGNETVIVTLDTTDSGLFTIDGSNNSDTVTITDNDSALNSVSITATDASAAEASSNPGQFTVDLGVVNHTGSAVTVNYTVTGTATNGSTDYTSLSGSVSIADGQQTATIAVAGIIDDALVEGNETVIVTLDSTSDSLFTIDGSNNSDTVTITDNDSALNSVSISATDASAAETGTDPGQFTVDLGTINNTGSAVTVNYTVTGTATNGSTDYTSLSGSVSIADGQQTATIAVAGIIDDALVEGNETVIVTLDSTSDSLFTIDGSNNSDTVTITDNDSALNSVSISATDASAAEASSNPGQFTVDLGTINNTGSAVTINYTVTGTATNGGTDYTSLSGSVSIADGQQTATIDVAGIIDDALVEGNETVIVTLDTTNNGLFTIDGSNNSDTVTITDNDSALNSVSISATDASAAETGTDPGQFTVDLGTINNTGSAVTVNYTVTGTATNGSTDYTSLSGSVSIADGQQTATIAVAGIIDDALVEGNETVIVTLDTTDSGLFTIDGSNNSDTVTITDNDSALNSVSITATDASAAEASSNPGQFTVDLGVVNHTGSAVTVNYTVTGTATNGSTDYTSLSGSVSIADGQQTATIAVAGIIDDALVEGNETVIVTLDSTSDSLFTIDGSNNSDTVTITDNDSALNSVSISATDASAAETGTDPGQFTVDLGVVNHTGSAVTVNYTVTGTATNGSTDYTSLSGSVSIADGQQTATIAVAGIIDDALVEGNETVIVTLDSTSDSLFTIDGSNNSDTVTITDNDSALNSVSISATDASAAEASSNPGQFTVDLGTINNTGSAVTINYTVTGTATNGGTDYTSLSGSVSIADGQQTATIDVAGIIDDALVEGNETVIVTLDTTNNGLFTIDGSNNSDTVTITDNDSALNSVSISATDASAAETGTDPGQFTVDLGVVNHTGSAVTVNYTVTGTATNGSTDYTSLSGSVSIADGQQTATIAVAGIIDDALVEGNETVIVTLDSTSDSLFTIDGSNNSDTVTITDNDSALNSVSISATDASAAEASSNPGQFTVDLGTINNTGSAVTINYTVTGTATNGGTDYTSLSGSVSIADGQQTATIDVAGIIDDALVEGNETVIVTLDTTNNGLFTIDGSNNSDTVTITDNDSALNSVSISATDASAAETGTDPGQFTVDLGTINNTGSAVTVNYTVTGTATNGSTDYTSLSGSVSIADGQQTATIAVAGIIDDALVEGNETVIVTLDTTDSGLFTIDGSNNSDTVTITDNDSALNSVSITATDASAAEASSNPGQFTVDLGVVNHTGSAVTVNYTVTGTATNGSTDYTSLSGSVSIADGQQTATIAVAGIIDDALVEGNETVIVTLDSTSDSLFTIDGSNNSDTVTITDNDSALNSVSISATDASAAETGTDPGQFTVDLGTINNTGSAVTVNYTVTGTATNGSTDYTSLSGSVSIADGQQTATIAVAGIIDDALVEGNETVIVTLDSTSDSLFTIDGSNNSDTVTITDNDSALNSVSISATDASAAEASSNPGQFTVDLGTINNTGSAVTINYTVTGTATNGGTDYTSLSGSVSIADGQQTATIDVAGIIDDALVEGNETVIVTLDTTNNGLFTIDGSNNSDTVTITDNDSALNSVSISATDASAAETGTDPGQFTVDLGTINNTGSAVTVNYTVTGTATNGSTDYTSLSGSVSIADGQQTATIAVAGIIDDALVEGNETVIVTLDTTDSGLFTIDGSNNSDTVTITDNDSALNSVSITATDASAAEASSNPGQFTVDLGVVNHTGSAVTVNYTVTGTATNGSTDYTSLSGSVSIADGQQTATIAVAGIIDDALVEGNETVIVTLDSTSDSLFTIDGSNNSDTVTITDNDSALNSVSISATDASAAETGTDPGQFTVDLGVVNHTGSAVTVNYTVTGTATNGGTDYTSLSGSVSIADGQQTATIDVAGIIDDALVEGNETVIVTLDTTNNGLFTIDGSNNSDTVTITDNDSALNSVSITATDASAAEASSNPGQFTVDLGVVNHTGSAVTVNYTVTGTATNGSTDYTSLSGSVSIADGQQTATIAVAGIIDDALVEGNETVIVTLDSTSDSLFTIDGSNNSDTVTITDNDSALNSVSISATDASAAETGTDPGQFTVDLGVVNHTGSAVTVNYTVTGTATNGGTDYTSLSGSVSIADGQQTATIDVAGIIDDALVEGNETVIVTLDTTNNGLFTIDGSNNSDTVTITDNDSALNSVSISATDASAAETGTDPGQFTVDLGTINNTGSAVTVNYTVTGTATNGSTDYTSLSGSVSIADGQQTATIAVAGIIDDALVEGNETVIVTLDSTSDSLFTIDGSNNSDTVTITDNDSALNSVSISATDASAAETGTDPGQFTVDLGVVNHTGSAVTVNYTVTGTATNGGTDYTSLSGSVSIADGQQTATIAVAGIIDDALVEGNETVIVTLDATNNGLFTIDGSNNSDTVTITDNDSALNSVSISATDPGAAEASSNPGQFTVDLGTINNTGSAVTVNYTVTGTATNGGTDYTSLSGSVSIADGQQTATIDVAGIIDDALVEGNETVIVTLDTTNNGLFTIDGSNNSDTVTITDNDSALNSVSISATDPGAAEASSNPGQFTVDLGTINNTGSAVTVNYTVTGTATNGGTDYTSLSGSVSIADGQRTATIAVAGIIDDALVEGNETVIVTLDTTDSGLFTIDGSNNSDTVTITDNDSALNSVSITATDPGAAEASSNPGQFTVDLGTINNTGSAVTVNYTVAGTATNGGTDYTSLSGSVSIADGQQTATIDVAGIIDDALVEGNETVIVTLDTTDSGLFTIDGSNNSDTVTITDNDSALNSVSITATDASAAEASSNPGQFTVDLGVVNHTGSAVTVNYTVTGTATNGSTDYTSLSGSVSIADGQQTATIAVAGIIDDALVEGNETVIVTLDSTSDSLFTIDGSNNSDTVTITDNDSALNSVSISATDASAAETGTDPGQFTVDLGVVNHTGSAVTVNYTVTGTATNGGTDYTSLSGSVSIADGQQTATIAVAGIIDDALVEGNETVIVTLDATNNGLFTIDGSNNSDTVTITDNDSALNSVSISATDPGAAEASSNPGQFTVDLGTINNTGSAVTVNYTVTGTATNGGTDYTSLSGSVSIADGQQTATIDVAGIIDDALVEGNETVIVTLDTTNNGLFTIDGSNNSDTVTITDNDSALNSVSISATDPGAAEASSNPGQFTVDLGTINNTGSAVTVNYTVTGTATATDDYTALSGSVSIADGQRTATIAVAGIIDDALVEGNETVIVTLDTTDNGLFTIDGSNNSDTVTVADNDTTAVPTVTRPIGDQSASEDSAFTFQFATDTFSDADGDTLRYTAKLSDNSDLPTWLSFDANTRTFSGTPTSNDIGEINIQVTASDGASTVSDIFKLTINNVNDAPVAADDEYSIDEDNILSITSEGILNNDGDEDSDALSAVLVDPPSHGVLTFNSDGSFDYVPDPDFNGEDTFTYKATDGELESNLARVNLLVNAIDDEPVTHDESFDVDFEEPLSIDIANDILFNDSDVDSDKLNLIGFTQPEHGELTDNGDGTLSYRPHTGFSGIDHFVYTFSDGLGGTGQATATINVSRNGLSKDATQQDTDLADLEAGYKQQEDYFKEPVIDVFRYSEQPVWQSSELTSIDNNESNLKDDGSSASRVDETSESESALDLFNLRDEKYYQVFQQVREVSQVTNEYSSGITVYAKSIFGSIARPLGSSEGETDSEAPDSRSEVLNNQAMWRAIDLMKSQMDDTRDSDMVLQGIVGATLTFSAGSVTWLLRGGSLMASFLSSVPVWTNFDPLPVLTSPEKSRRERKVKANSESKPQEVPLDSLFDTSGTSQTSQEKG